MNHFFFLNNIFTFLLDFLGQINEKNAKLMRKIVQSHDVPHHRDDFDRFFFLFQINVYPTCFITSCSSYILRFVRFSFCYVYFYKLFNTTKERTFFASLENILNVKYPCETINYPDEDFVSRRIEKNLSPI